MARMVADLNAYGKYVQLSALADYVEVAALRGVPLGHAQLTHRIQSNGWTLKDFFLQEGEDRSDIVDIDDAREAATAVCAVIDERVDSLGEVYPFVWGEGGRLTCCVAEIIADPYLALLSVAVCHAFGLSQGVTPHEVFEDVVAEAMNRCCLRAVNLSGRRRTLGNFDDAVRDAGCLLGLQATPEAAARLRYAFEEGVDTLCHYPLGDLRPGLWTMIGQATCEKSESWKHKLGQPKPEFWRLLLGIVHPRPWVFLAVPYHVTSDYLLKLIQDDDAVVIDRIRLVRFKTTVSHEEKELIEVMREVELE